MAASLASLESGFDGTKGLKWLSKVAQRVMATSWV